MLSDYVGDLQVFRKSLDMKMYWSTRKVGKPKPLIVRSEKGRILPTMRKNREQKSDGYMTVSPSKSETLESC